MAQLYAFASAGSSSRTRSCDCLAHRFENAGDRQGGQLTSQTLAELWEQTARKFPRSTAIISESPQLSYAEVNEQANRLARMLIDQGAGPERLAGLALPPYARRPRDNPILVSACT
ncbi:AMP-binding enzyme [Actinacidiphila yanglinensis]|uniref:AMP-binding enzyme n=1 Tax=Actinacidiphila yanglinensis TaxID=310779 RepID=A0A1H6DLW5_9ACTN|nr:AMP-binding enzyme [Actinacidiphila yanglinensis]